MKKELGEKRRMKLNLEYKLQLLMAGNESVKENLLLCSPDTFDADTALPNNVIEDKIECTICAEPFPTTNLHSFLVLR